MAHSEEEIVAAGGAPLNLLARCTTCGQNLGKEEVPMGRTAILSVDGHVKASRSTYRDYIEKKYLEAYDESVRKAVDAGVPDAGNLNPLTPAVSRAANFDANTGQLTLGNAPVRNARRLDFTTHASSSQSCMSSARRSSRRTCRR